MIYASRKSQQLHSIVQPMPILLAPPSVLAKIEKPMETFVSLAPRVEGSCRVMGSADRGEGAIK